MSAGSFMSDTLVEVVGWDYGVGDSVASWFFRDPEGKWRGPYDCEQGAREAMAKWVVADQLMFDFEEEDYDIE